MAPKEGDYLELAHQRAREKKSHVSFPQMKYPSLRDEGLKHPVQWLQGKAMDDNAEGLWRVHDGIYDLNEFIKKHPGGEEWLQLTKGTDITEVFECHHIGTVAEEMLKKFYVREAKGPRNSPFTFKDDGFYRTLKRAVREEIKKVPKDLPKRTDRIIDGLFATCLINSALACWSTNYWVSLMAYLAASLSMAWIVVAAHNYIHRRPNWRMYLFNIGLWSYRDFRVSHVLSHHVYPNTLMDLEVSGFEPFVSWNPRRDKSLISKFAIIIEILVFPFGFIINFIKRFLQNFMVKNFYEDHYRWHDGVAFLLPVWMFIISGASFYEAFIMWLWIVCTASSIFFHIGSNAAHHHPKIFKDGDEIEDETPDWGLHELEAVVDRNDINGNLFKVMTFFGDHALHHLFPTLDHAILPSLYPVFYELCEKYKGNYRQTSSLDLIAGQIRMSLKTEPTLLKDKWYANNWWKKMKIW